MNIQPGKKIHRSLTGIVLMPFDIDHLLRSSLFRRENGLLDIIRVLIRTAWTFRRFSGETMAFRLDPFGRTVAEGLIVAYRHDVLPALIDGGETGFLAPSFRSPSTRSPSFYPPKNPAGDYAVSG